MKTEQRRWFVQNGLLREMTQGCVSRDASTDHGRTSQRRAASAERDQPVLPSALTVCMHSTTSRKHCPADSGSLLERLRQALLQAALHSPRPFFASLYEKGGYKGASRLSVSPLSLNGAGWVVVSSATTGTFTVSSF